MTEFRKSAVYDLSSLKLQQGANRVNPDVGPKARPSEAKTRVQDSRGNWIARDAGGPSQVKRFKRIAKRVHDDADDGQRGDTQEWDQSDDRAGNQNGSTAADDDNEVEEHQKWSSKKLKFSQGLEFLVRNAQAAQRNSLEEREALPAPTAEMLQLIHRHAGNYYFDRGLLSETVRSKGKASECKKGKDVDKIDKRDKSRSVDRQLSMASHTSSEEEGDTSSMSESETESVIEEHEDVSLSSERLRSMSRSLDGSALLAIGILAQEFIREMLNAQPSPRQHHQPTTSSGREQVGDDDDECSLASDREDNPTT